VLGILRLPTVVFQLPELVGNLKELVGEVQKGLSEGDLQAVKAADPDLYRLLHLPTYLTETDYWKGRLTARLTLKYATLVEAGLPATKLAAKLGKKASAEVKALAGKIVQRVKERRLLPAATSGGRVAAAEAGAARLALADGPRCFAAGTPLLTPTGAKAVEEFRRGDVILSRSEVDLHGPLEAKEVEDVFVRLAFVVEVHVGGRTIRTTAEHPFFVLGEGWRAAGHLSAGDLLCSHDGALRRVERVIETRERTTVFNLRVADYHTYFVGCQEWGFSVWAHNACTLQPGELKSLGAEYARRLNAQAAAARRAGRTGPLTVSLEGGGWDEIANLRSGRYKGLLSKEDKAAIRAYAESTKGLLDDGVSIRITSPTGRNGTQAHIDDVARNNAQASGVLRPEPIGRRVPDGVGKRGQKVVIRGVEIDPGPNGRVIVESEPFTDGGIPISDGADGGRAQLRDIRAAEPAATIVVTDPDKLSRPPLIYRPGTQPPPPGHYRGGQTHVPAPTE
jgi:hypothetical protein